MKQALMMIALSTAIDLVTPGGTALSPQYGTAKYYRAGVMENVAVYRGLLRRGNIDGMASTPNCSNLGKVAFAAINGGHTERYLIVDCSGPRDRARHVRQGLIIEVDYQSAVRNHFHREGSAPAVIITISNN